MLPDASPEQSASGQAATNVPKLDRRRERTRRTLLGAFNALLFERGYEDIKVADILERADIGRSTFYQHYRSKEDLLRRSVTPIFSVLAASVIETEAPPRLQDMVAHIGENRRLARVLFRDAVRLVLSRCLAELIEPHLPDPTILPKPLAARHVAEAQLGLLAAWVTGPFACRPEEIAAALRATSVAMATALG